MVAAWSRILFWHMQKVKTPWPFGYLNIFPDVFWHNQYSDFICYHIMRLSILTLFNIWVKFIWLEFTNSFNFIHTLQEPPDPFQFGLEKSSYKHKTKLNYNNKITLNNITGITLQQKLIDPINNSLYMGYTIPYWGFNLIPS